MSNYLRNSMTIILKKQGRAEKVLPAGLDKIVDGLDTSALTLTARGRGIGLPALPWPPRE
jgi:hypothetical protein